MLGFVIQLCPTFCDPMDSSQPGSYVCGDSPGKNTGEGCQALLQGILPTQGLNPGLPHCRRILYCLSHQGSPRIPEWVACPFSRGTSQPRNWTRVSHIAGGFFTDRATREAPTSNTYIKYGKEKVGTKLGSLAVSVLKDRVKVTTHRVYKNIYFFNQYQRKSQ